jgi:L,D-peptidoglycan transpeptidase YkuD (ErfK/YbiS/YcfS/YnhG family)
MLNPFFLNNGPGFRHIQTMTLSLLCLVITLLIPFSSHLNNINGSEPSSTALPFLEEFLTTNATVLRNSGQLIIVTNQDASSCKVAMHVLEKYGTLWRPPIPAFSGTIGRKGFASFDKKLEGDGKSPTGMFSLGTAFGYAPSMKTKMPYRQATDNDFWVDDIRSADYNRWVRGRPKTASVEKMKREDGLYRHGIVIEYNMHPIVRGKGSAVFLHRWQEEGKSTRGCVAMPEDHILKLLAWLDPAQKPMIMMGTESELHKMQPR